MHSRGRGGRRTARRAPPKRKRRLVMHRPPVRARLQSPRAKVRGNMGAVGLGVPAIGHTCWGPASVKTCHACVVTTVLRCPPCCVVHRVVFAHCSTSMHPSIQHRCPRVPSSSVAVQRSSPKGFAVCKSTTHRGRCCPARHRCVWAVPRTLFPMPRCQPTITHAHPPPHLCANNDQHRCATWLCVLVTTRTRCSCWSRATAHC